MMPPETTTQTGGAAGVAIERNEFESLLSKEFKARDTQKQSAVQSAVRTLAEQALSGARAISPDAIKTISALIAEIDRKLSEQVNLIMHHEDFKGLEGT
ncbi:MAG TPA: type VI secretion system contractile sheath large subunit, partial [Verrucomicrobiae bacterium]|nr:type VI secretion system contractile sheath large subunit [Verrucomicrobiae bacterium]